ncbi:MAG: hypothetical protein QG552_2749 [Thermodesulfobacteriota bacterium]|nr:hypothetical protein [Thermodesulfobacteriota bacterium]
MPEDIYVGNFENYAGAFGRPTEVPLGALPPQQSANQYASSFSGYTDRELQSSTSALKEAIDTARSVMGQITSAVASTVNAVKGLYSSAVSAASPTGFQVVQRGQFGAPPIEVGRYVGSSSYLESAKGAFGYGGSPFMMRGDYQQIMSGDFARRTTLLGGSVGSVATEFGAGYLGSKLLGPMISKGLFGTLAGGMLGYMGGGYVASHIMGRINQGLEFDSLIKDVSSRAGVDEGERDPGFNAANRRKIAKGLRKGDLGMGDYADVMMYGSEAGLFRGVVNPDEFVNTVKNAAKQVKALMKILRETDVRDAVEDIAMFKQWGIPMDQQVSFAVHAKAVGRSLGLTAKGAMQIAASGAQVGMQMGYTGEFGANVGLRGAVIGNALLQSKAVSEREMARYGGPEGYGQMVNWSLASKVETPLGKMLVASMMKKGEGGEYVLDEKLYERYTRGEVGVQELQRLAAGKLRNDPTLYDKAMNLPGQLQEIMGDNRWGSLMAGTYQSQVKRAIDRGYSRERAELDVSMGIMGNFREAGILRAYGKGESDIAKKDIRAIENERIETAKEEARSKYGISARVGRFWDKTVGYAFGKIDQGIDDYVTDPVVGMTGSVKDWVDTTYDQKVLGLHVTKLPEQEMPKGFAVEKLSVESQKRVDEWFGEIQKRAESSKNKEVSASVYADELKEDIRSFGAERSAWGKSTGAKLIQADAYENIGSLVAALQAENRESLGRIGKQSKLSDDGIKKMREYYDLVENEKAEYKNELLVKIQKSANGIRELEVGGPGKALITQQSEHPVDMVRHRESGKRIWDDYEGGFVSESDAGKTGAETMIKLGQTADTFGVKEGGAVLGEQEYAEQMKGKMAFEDGSEMNMPDKTSGQGGGWRNWWSSLGIVPEKVIHEEGMPAPEGGYAFMCEGAESVAGEYAPVPMSEEEYSRQGFVIKDPSLEVHKRSKTWERRKIPQRKDMFGVPVPGPFVDKEEAGKLDELLDLEAWGEKWDAQFRGMSVGDVAGSCPMDVRDKWREGLENSPMGSVGWSLAYNISWDMPRGLGGGGKVGQQNEMLGKGAGVPRSIVNADVYDEQADGVEAAKTREAAKKTSRELSSTANSARELTKSFNGLSQTIMRLFNRSVNSSNSF